MEQAYLDLGRKLLEEGHRKEDRTGTGTLSLFGYQMRFDLQKGFPLLTTKRVPFGLIKSELLWFLKEIRISAIYYKIKTIFGMNGHLNATSKVQTIMDQI